jgi:hypothetical protein
MFSAVPRASGPVFLFCHLGPVFSGTDRGGSHFHVLHSQTHFGRYRRRRVPFSCVALPVSFSAVPTASGLVFMICTPGLGFGGTEGVRFCFHVLRSRTHFRRYRGRQVPFSYFPLLDSFSTVSMASGPVFMFCAPGPVFMFCAPGPVFVSTELVVPNFHVLRSRTYFRRYRGRRLPFSYFTLSDLFSSVSIMSVLFFMFCAPRLIFGST